MRAAALITVMLLLWSCKSGPLEVMSRSIGSSADREGNINDARLEYTFKKPPLSRRAADLVNHIYFQGDCIHFSYTLNRSVVREKISVVFSGPRGATSMPAERLEIRQNTIFGIPTSFTVYGFSLVGSVLERLHEDKLGLPAPSDGYCCRDIPFEITLEVDDDGSRVKDTIRSAFRIGYEHRDGSQ